MQGKSNVFIFYLFITFSVFLFIFLLGSVFPVVRQQKNFFSVTFTTRLFVRVPEYVVNVIVSFRRPRNAHRRYFVQNPVRHRYHRKRLQFSNTTVFRYSYDVVRFAFVITDYRRCVPKRSGTFRSLGNLIKDSFSIFRTIVRNSQFCLANFKAPQVFGSISSVRKL